MAGTDNRSIKVLFREWRQGDPEAGQIMAQRFADWYYAIATSRLGEDAGKGPCEAACSKFGEGVASVAESRALVGWAHGIIQEELRGHGDRITDGDFPNAYTGNQPPKALLCRAREALADDVALLERCYREGTDQEIEPVPLLRARYRVKQWMRDNAGVPFEVAPDDPVLDRAPMPLYESGRMKSTDDEANFEQWLISDLEACKDIAEFAHFSIALRGGLPSAAEFAKTKASQPAPAPKPKAAAAQADSAPAASSSGATTAAVGGGVAVLAVGGLFAVIVVLAIVYFMMGSSS